MRVNLALSGVGLLVRVVSILITALPIERV
jgi:hypothetical protein